MLKKITDDYVVTTSHLIMRKKKKNIAILNWLRKIIYIKLPFLSNTSFLVQY